MKWAFGRQCPAEVRHGAAPMGDGHAGPCLEWAVVGRVGRGASCGTGRVVDCMAGRAGDCCTAGLKGCCADRVVWCSRGIVVACTEGCKVVTAADRPTWHPGHTSMLEHTLTGKVRSRECGHFGGSFDVSCSG